MHEDKPTMDTFRDAPHGSGQAHKRMLELFFRDENVKCLELLQGRAARANAYCSSSGDDTMWC